MSECKHRRKGGVCLQDLEYVYKGYCVDGPCSCFEPQTNADRIRAMTDEELAEWMATKTSCMRCPVDLGACNNFAFSGEMSCEEILLSWLKSPVEVDNE